MPVTLAYQDTPPEVTTRRSWTWLVGLVAAIGVLIAAWPLSSWQMRQSVVVESAGQMKCTGSTPVTVDSAAGPAYRLAPGMQCKITYKITNSAPLTVHLQTATFHLLGPGTGLALRAVKLGTGTGATMHGAANAVYDLDRDLNAGESATFSIRAVFNADGCTHDGTKIFVTKGPDVRMSFLNSSGTQTGNLTYTLVGTKDSCNGR